VCGLTGPGEDRIEKRRKGKERRKRQTNVLILDIPMNDPLRVEESKPIDDLTQ
jgi:hypothetical protein